METNLEGEVCVENEYDSSFYEYPLSAKWNIHSMHCSRCVRIIQNVLDPDEEESPKINLETSLETKTASRCVESIEQAHDLTDALIEVGMDARLLEVSPRDTKDNKDTKDMKDMKEKTETTNGHENRFDPIVTIDVDPLAPIPSLDMEAPPLLSPPPPPPPPSHPSHPVTTKSFENVEMLIGGMTCSMCTKAISNALESTEGVRNVHVSLSTNLASMEYDTALVSSVRDLQDVIEDIGYEVQDIINKSSDRVKHMTKQQQQEVWKRKIAFVGSLLGTVPIVTITMLFPHVVPRTSRLMQWLHETVRLGGHDFLRESVVLCVLATIVQFGSGWTFYKTAYFNIRSGLLGMDVLVTLGTTASYFYGWLETWDGSEAHVFETSSVLICFVLLGKWMNSLAVRRTSEALTQLMQLQPKTAILVRNEDDNAIDDEKIVPVEQIRPGDTVKILRGASIPADGVVSSEGNMMVDESMITGESMPVWKTPGSLVLGGTVCVEEGAGGTRVCVTGVGGSTALSQIVRLVQEAQTRQVPIQSLADTISSVFVPTVCTLSVLTFMVWYALCNTGVVPREWYLNDGGEGKFSMLFGIACLVISCPCALGLATPTAVMVGTGVGAKHGVLMKGGDSLEAASKVNSVVFDKTGTLTKGSPCITDFCLDQGYANDPSRKQHLLWLLGSLERNSEHPLAMAVVSYVKQHLDESYQPFAQPTRFQALTGRGASGVMDGHDVAVGNRLFMSSSCNITIPTVVEERMIQLEQEGKTAVLAAVDGGLVVVMGIADQLKEDAALSIKYLQDVLKVEVWMVTGDNARTARAIADQLGLDQERVIAEALPGSKVQQVKKLQQDDNRIVAMIGDGINDSPALAQANVGMSLGTGAQIATEAADMVLVKGKHVSDVCTALHLSRVLFKRIQWNFVFSLLYNCLGIPVAAGVFYPLLHTRLPPTLAAIAMALSSLSVVGSSLALRLYKPPTIIKRDDEEDNRPNEATVNDMTLSLLENDHLVMETMEKEVDVEHAMNGINVDNDNDDNAKVGDEDTSPAAAASNVVSEVVEQDVENLQLARRDSMEKSSSLVNLTAGGLLRVGTVVGRWLLDSVKNKDDDVLRYEEMVQDNEDENQSKKRMAPYDKLLLQHIEEGQRRRKRKKEST